MTGAALLWLAALGAQAPVPVTTDAAPALTAPALPAPTAPPRVAVAPPPVAPPAWLAGTQYLYGSGEAAALSRATWAALVDFVTRARVTEPHQGVVLAPDSDLVAPRFIPCGTKPPAVVLDVDESAILNDGWQYDDASAGGRAFDAARWRRWEETGADKVLPTPGAVEGVARLRALNVAVVFVTNRDAAAAAATARALAAAGLGTAMPGETLFLRAAGAGTGKDAVRRQVAERFCVLAMLGDQLGDFSDLFDRPQTVNARRAATAVPAVADLWGEGWFVQPNPVYGNGLRGSLPEIFPPAQRWTDPGPAAPASASNPQSPGA